MEAGRVSSSRLKNLLFKKNNVFFLDYWQSLFIFVSLIIM